MANYNNRTQEVDLKRILKYILCRAWLIVLITAVGTLLGAGIYKLYTGITNGETKYRISNDYYIYFNYDEFIHAEDFYNAYTWNGFLMDDPIVDYAMILLPSDYSKEQVKAAVSGEILSDYRVLTVHVTSTDPDMTQKISDAYIEALRNFGETEDMLEEVRVWSVGDIYVLDENTRTPNAAFLGGFIGLIVAIFGLLFAAAIDDRIYSERDWVERYADIPWLGKKGSDEWKANTEYLLKDGDYDRLVTNDFAFSASAFEDMRKKKGIVICLDPKKDRGEKIDKIVYTLKKQNITISGAETE